MARLKKYTFGGSLTNEYSGTAASGFAALVAGIDAKQNPKASAYDIQLAETRKQIELENAQNGNILASYPTKGVYGSQLYKYGGKLKKMAIGGNLIPMSNGTQLAVGDEHGEDTNNDGQGGINVGNGNEVEDGEVLTNDGKVFSKRLGFADIAKKIIATTEYQKLEKEKTRNELKGSNPRLHYTGKNTVTRNLEKIEMVNPLTKLFNMQEKMTAELGLKNEEQMKYGGRLKKYPYGGQLGKPIVSNSNNTEELPYAFMKYEPINMESKGLYNYNSTNEVRPTSVSNGSYVDGSFKTAESNSDFPSKGEINVSQYGRFIDNIVNQSLTNKTPKIPNQRLTNYRPLNTTYEINAPLNAANSDYAALVKNIDRGTTDLSTALSNKQNAYVNLLKNKGQLYNLKTNEENKLKNINSTFLSQGEAANNQIDFNNNMNQAMRLDDINKRKSANAANLSEDFAAMSIDKQAAQNDKSSIILYSAALLNKNGVLSRSPQMRAGLKAQGFSDEEINDLFNNKLKK